MLCDQYAHKFPKYFMYFMLAVVECLLSHIILTTVCGEGIIIPISETGKHVENGSLKFTEPGR